MGDVRGSVTNLVQQMEAGDDAAAAQVWSRYCVELASLARRRLSSRTKRIIDEEDVALATFNGLLTALRNGSIEIEDRNDLRKVLKTIMARKAQDAERFVRRQKRGGGNVRGESVLETAEDKPARTFDQVEGAEESPSEVAMVAEQFEELLEILNDDTLRETALLKLEGYSTAEIAKRQGCVRRTVERKIERIRAIWLHSGKVPFES